MIGYKIFILIFLELTSFMLLWNMFNKKYEKRLFKSIFIVICTSSVVVLTNYIYPPLQSLINYIVVFLFIKLIFKKSTKYLFLEFGLVLAISSIMQLAVIIILRLFIPAFLLKDDFSYYIIADFICVILSSCTYKYVSYGRLSIFFKQESSKIYFFSVNLFIYIVAARWLWSFKRHQFLDEIAMYLIIPVVLILANLFFLEYHMKSSEIKKSVEEYEKYSPVISELLEDVRRRQHDFKNHLNTIYGLVMISDERNLKETISQYMNSVNISLENMEKVLQIDNSVVTAIIYNKINEAAKNNIEFDYSIQSNSRFPFKDHELSEVLNNLLDNAFEAVLNSENYPKKVFLNIGYLEENCVIEIGNTGDRIELNDIGKIFNAGYTTKRGENRGYGLYNVKKIVESCSGKIQLSFENNYTIFSIKLT
ncbi:GHKL domain-containing protein [Clostridium sp. YIM B02515]|uniref:GHKL domain-containing protein n=1 Tax=Clostridium rhizosphaerae TaxID=2803861 RepID=A0ABS1T852_9CLOT|nr:GHKL domain-containing protein [Clostridium rhizosphaerae]MBL4935510.1 GHKL domain-containing protein [Clostridium rhizosphaerae]